MQTAYKLLLLVLLTILSNSQFPTFPEYVKAFNKTYEGEQYQRRQQYYQKRIQTFLTITDYTPGVNDRTDWSDQEVNAMRTLQLLPSQARVGSKMKLGATRLGAAQSLDWRTKNAVTSIKNQKSCGCCWAFATVAYAESKLIIEGKYTVDNINLAEQYMLQCTKYSNCDGGYLQYAIQQVKTVPTQEQFPYSPYTSYSGICYASGITSGYIGQMYYSLTDSQLIDLLQTGPVAISISSVGWLPYAAGVFSCKSSDQVDHAVLLIGYTSQYWIVKNQWGTTWGEAGYIRVNRNPANNCKIGTSAAILCQIRVYGMLVFIFGLLLSILI